MTVARPRIEVGEDSGTITVSFLVEVVQTLMENFEVDVRDTALRLAHEAGHMPVGEPWVDTHPATVDMSAEGEKFKVRGMEELALDHKIMSGDIVEASAEFILGLSI